MKLQSHPSLMPMLEQIKDSAMTEYQFRMTNNGQIICNEEVFHNHREHYAKSACCRADIVHLGDLELCGDCGNIADKY
jgi:hypothetical protein